MKLMIVDDHPGVRRLIRQIAALAEDVVCECESGEAAVRLAPQFRPDCITMDLRMTGMSGFDAAFTLRALLPEVRIVIVSAYDQPELRVAAELAGAAAYVVKDDLTRLRDFLCAA